MSVDPITRRKSPHPAAVVRGCLVLCAALLAGSALAASPAHGKDARPEVTKARPAKAKPAKAKPTKAKAARHVAGPRGKAQPPKPGPLADFRGTDASPEVVHVANWVSYTRNAGGRAFVLIDKKNAQLYVFDPRGKLKSHSQVLLGKAIGDTSAPGIGNKPLSQIKESEKTTPAGRFQALPGKNTRGDDIIWIDYGAAVSMHRMHSVSAQERRAERMATPDSSDNRISNGCVNVPPSFFNSVLRPTVLRQGAFVYVLPETRTPQQLFGSYDVPGDRGKAPAVAKAADGAGRKAS